MMGPGACLDPMLSEFFSNLNDSMMCKVEPWEVLGKIHRHCRGSPLSHGRGDSPGWHSGTLPGEGYSLTGMCLVALTGGARFAEEPHSFTAWLLSSSPAFQPSQLSAQQTFPQKTALGCRTTLIIVASLSTPFFNNFPVLQHSCLRGLKLFSPENPSTGFLPVCSVYWSTQQ